MIRIVIFVTLFVCAGTAFGQVPPGPPFDAARHPNAILTYVGNSDFKAATYAEAQEEGDMELLGLSRDEGRRESIELAVLPSRTMEVEILGRDVDVTFYPVVRQTFALSDGGQLVLHSFKFPRVPIPSDVAESVLNEAAFEKPDDPEDGRFGLAAPPERLDVRGNSALLFDEDDVRTVFWVENGVAHTATTGIPHSDLLRVVRDLL